MAKKKKSAKRPKRRTFQKHSPWLRVHQEVVQGAELRQTLIAKLERQFDARVVTLFASFYKQEAVLVDTDAEMIENVLAAQSNGKKIVLILNSAGGFGLAAERIVNTIRAYTNSFEVVVPHMAKSAATLICFGADKIHMSRTSELGPVDPQATYTTTEGDDPSWISAEEYIRSYDQLMGKATSGDYPRIEAFIQQLARYDDRFIEQLRSSRDLADDISVRLLQVSMMRGSSKTEIRKKIKAFLSQEMKKHHGRMILYDEAVNCGLKVNLIDLQSDEWNNIWELFVRSNWVVTHRAVKLMESRATSLST